MALIYCRKCGARISEYAPKCPKCGAEQNVQTTQIFSNENVGITKPVCLISMFLNEMSRESSKE